VEYVTTTSPQGAEPDAGPVQAAARYCGRSLKSYSVSCWMICPVCDTVEVTLAGIMFGSG
jgi:hypothetical protein